MTKSRTKTLIFTTLGTLQLKKVISLYLRIDHARGYMEEKNGNKYLIFDSLNENKEVSKKYANVWDWVENKRKAINGDECDYGKDYMKIKFNSDDDLPLNNLLKFHLMTIIIRCVFSEDGQLYPQLSLDDTLNELVYKYYNTQKLMFQKELM